MDTGPARERGFTLIELVMAMTLLSIAIFGMASVFTSAARTSGVDLHRATAVGLATRATEDLKTYSYASLGLPTGTSSGPACDAAATIATVDGSTMLLTDPVVTVSGVSYTVNRCVTWVDATTSQLQAYKRTTAIVTWTDVALAHRVRQDSAVYPGGQGGYVAGGASLTTTTVACSVSLPTAPTVSAVPSSDGRTVDLTWPTPSVSLVPIRGWAVDYQVGTTGPWSVYSSDGLPAPLGSANEVFVSGLAPATLYQFRVTSLAASGCNPSPASVVTATTSGSLGAACVIGLVSLGSPVASRDASRHIPDLPVTVATSGTSASCAGLQLSFQPSATSVPQTVPLTLQAGGAWTVTLVTGAYDWDLGNHAMKVVQGVPVVAQANLCVQRAAVPSC